MKKEPYDMKSKNLTGKNILILAAVMGFLAISNIAGAAPGLLDISGVEWVEGDTFLAVSDAKYPDERQLTRVSLLELPASLSGMTFKRLNPGFPGALSSDLESVTGIPGTNRFLLVESADDNGSYQRIFLAQILTSRPTFLELLKLKNHTNLQGRPKGVRVMSSVKWNDFTRAYNIEASAVAQTDSGLIFIWAERNTLRQSTDIKWTDLQEEPFAIGKSGNIDSIPYTLPDDLINSNGDPLYNRAIVGMDVDSAGNIYTVAAFDPEGLVQDPDSGPYRSIVLKIGRVTAESIVLDAEPTTMGVLDGFKVESVTVRENGRRVELFVGTDDENYGAALRPLPSR